MSEILDNQTNFDPKNVSIMPTGNKWGLILGGVGIALTLVFHLAGMMDYTGTKSNMIPNIINWSSTGLIFYLGIKEFKEQDLQGYLSLGQAMKMGLYIALISGILTAVFVFFFFKYIQPDMMSTIMESAIEKAEEKGQDAEKVKQGFEMMKWMFSPGSMSVFALLGTLFIGTIISLIVGLILKKERPIFR
jgi:Protein of unknown function (DUF4199)